MKYILAATLLTFSTMGEAQSIKDLDFLIGKWELSEVTYPGTPKEYIETGQRQCAYALLGNYIQCESRSVRHGKERVYVFMINYVPNRKAFHLTSLFSDYPQQGAAELFLNPTLKQIQIASLPDQFGDDSFTRSIIDFSDPNKVVWEGWTSPYTEKAQWKSLYRETATRTN